MVTLVIEAAISVVDMLVVRPTRWLGSKFLGWRPPPWRGSVPHISSSEPPAPPRRYIM